MTACNMSDSLRQTVVTRLACVNSALSFLSLINGPSAAVAAEDVLALAEHLEKWAWRDLLQDSPGEPTTTDEPAPAEAPAPPTPEPPRQTNPPQVSPPQINRDGQAASKASGKQIGALFAIGRAKGYSPADVKSWVKDQAHKGVDDLSSQEASQLITRLKAL